MIMERLKMPEGEPIEHALVTRSIESAQRKVEAHNFDIRKQLLEYDNVANDQRRNIYELRNAILDGDDVAPRIKALRDGVVWDYFRAHVPTESVEEQWDLAGLQSALQADFGLQVELDKLLAENASITDEDLLAALVEAADQSYAAKMALTEPEMVRQYERWIMLQTLDQHWREHLAALDHLRQGIHLRGYAQKNPKQEYKREAFELFGGLLDIIKLEVTRVLMNVRIKSSAEVREAEESARAEEQRALERAQYQHPSYAEAAAVVEEPEGGVAVAERPKQMPFQRNMGKIGRNDPCPCGSGKKYKHCHGKLS